MRGRRSLVLLVPLLVLAACGGDGEPGAPRTWLERSIASLADPSPARRAAAASTLAGYWPRSARAIPVLVLALDDESEAVRTAARRALKAHAVRAAPTLVRSIGSLRRGRERELEEILGFVAALEASLTPTDVAYGLDPKDADHPEWRGAGAISLALARIASADEPAFLQVAWRAAVDDPDVAVRMLASTSLAILGADAMRREIADPWIVTLPDAEQATLVGALSSPPAAGDDPPVEVAGGLRVSRSPEFLARWAALSLLDRLPVTSDGVVRALVRLAERDPADSLVLDALAGRDPGALRRVLRSTGALTRPQASALLHIGDAARVRKALTAPRSEARFDAAAALVEYGVLDDGAREVLVEGVLSPSDGFRREQVPYALDLIGGFGPDAGGETAARLKSQGPGDPEFADLLSLALARLSPQGIDLAETWRARTAASAERRANPSAYEDSSWGLAFVHAVEGARDPHRLAELLTILGPPTDLRLVTAVCTAIGRSGPEATAAVAPLVKWITSVSVWIRTVGPMPETPTMQEIKRFGTAADWAYRLRAPAVEALGRIGPAAKSAIPVLEPLLHSSDERIRHLAARALRRIRAS